MVTKIICVSNKPINSIEAYDIRSQHKPAKLSTIFDRSTGYIIARVLKLEVTFQILTLIQNLPFSVCAIEHP